MAAGSTYTPIATTTLSSPSTNHTFNSIPGTYTDLVLVINGLIVGADAVQINLSINGTADNTRSYTRINGNGTTLSTLRSADDPGIGVLGDSQSGNIIANIMNYSNTTTYKTILTRYNSLDLSDSRVGAFASLWRSTSAITSLTITPNSALNWATGTIFTLYGIAAA
jgi:hypothetical protein